MRIFTVLCLALALAACASSDSAAQKAAVDDEHPFVVPEEESDSQSGSEAGEIFLQVIEEPIEDPHRRHYAFAHQILPTIFYASNIPTLATQLKSGLTPWLVAQWKGIGGGDELPSATEVPTPMKGRAYLIDMPPVVESPGAYFALLVIDLNGVHYFTLEKSILKPTVLGGWGPKDGSLTHFNYGDGTPADDPQAFVDAAFQVLRSQTK